MAVFRMAHSKGGDAEAGKLRIYRPRLQDLNLATLGVRGPGRCFQALFSNGTAPMGGA